MIKPSRYFHDGILSSIFIKNYKANIREIMSSLVKMLWYSSKYAQTDYLKFLVIGIWVFIFTSYTTTFYFLVNHEQPKIIIYLNEFDLAWKLASIIWFSVWSILFYIKHHFQIFKCVILLIVAHEYTPWKQYVLWNVLKIYFRKIDPYDSEILLCFFDSYIISE